MENINVNQMPFTADELKILDFSNEELNTILDSEALVKTVDMLPDEPDAVLNRLDKEIPNDLNAAFEKIAELAQKDPEYTKQLVAMNEIFDEVKPEAPEAKVKKVSTKQMSEQLIKEDVEKIKSLLRK